MTPPPPITFAGKGATSTGHRRTLRKRPAPAAPRRVSGPAGGRKPAARTAGAAATTARPASAVRSTARAATATAPATARAAGAARSTARVSRPAPRVRPLRTRRPASRARPAATLPARAAAFVRALPDHQLLDRLLRGRAWIAMLGVMLVGIVAMQVEVLKLGASVGRSLQLSTTLQSRNQLLRASVASLADQQRIEHMAAKMGMVMPAPSAVVFLTQAGGDAQRAASNIHVPNSSAFLAALPPTGAAAVASTGTGQTTSTSTALSGAGTTGSSTIATSVGTTGGTSTVPASTATTAPTATGGTTTGGSGALPTSGTPASTTVTGTPAVTGATATGAAALAPAATGTTSTGG
jgi:hypothetical protein